MGHYEQLKPQPSAKAAMCAAGVTPTVDDTRPGPPCQPVEHAQFAAYLAACADHIVSRAGLDGAAHAGLLYDAARAHAAVAQALMAVVR